MRKVLAWVGAAAGALLILGAIGIFVAHRYVNHLAPSEEELAQEIVFLREKLRPDFPPEENRKPLYAAFVERIDPSLLKTAADYREAVRHYLKGPKIDETKAAMEAMLRAMKADDAPPEAEGNEPRNGEEPRESPSPGKRTWGEDPRVTAANAWKYDAFCRGVDALREEFKMVTGRSRCQLLDEFSMQEQWSAAVWGGMSRFAILLRFRGQIAIATHDVPTAIACVHTILALAPDIWYHGTIVQILTGETCARMAAEMSSDILKEPGVETSALAEMLNAWKTLESRIVPAQDALLANELGFLTLHDVDSLAPELWGDASPIAATWYGFLFRFCLPGARGAALRLYRAAREPDCTAAYLDQLRERIVADAHFNLFAAAAACTPVDIMLPPKRAKALCPVHACILQLALELHRRAHGAFPESLSALDKAILAAPPFDPYAAEPFVYARTETGYVFYSVGLNGEDDGGTSTNDEDGLEGAADDIVYTNPEASPETCSRTPAPGR